MGQTKKLDLVMLMVKKEKKSAKRKKERTDQRDSEMSTPPSQVQVSTTPPIDLDLSNEIRSNTGSAAGLSDTVRCTTNCAFASLFSTMISEKLVSSDSARENLEVELALYLPKMGWISEDAIAASAGQNLPSPDTLLPGRIEDIEGIITKHEQSDITCCIYVMNAEIIYQKGIYH